MSRPYLSLHLSQNTDLCAEKAKKSCLYSGTHTHGLYIDIDMHIFFHALLLSSFWTSRGHRCRPFSPRRFLPSIFIAHGVQQSHCSSIFSECLNIYRCTTKMMSQKKNVKIPMILPLPPPPRHATRRPPHGASRLVRAMSAWLVKTRRAPSRHNRDARVYGQTTTAMHKLSTPSPPPPPLVITKTLLTSLPVPEQALISSINRSLRLLFVAEGVNLRGDFLRGVCVKTSCVISFTPPFFVIASDFSQTSFQIIEIIVGIFLGSGVYKKTPASSPLLLLFFSCYGL